MLVPRMQCPVPSSRRIAALALVIGALVAVSPAARAIYVPPIPYSEDPAWLNASTVRFESNFPSWETVVTYVVEADGSGLRPASDTEAHQAPMNPPTGEQLEFGSTKATTSPLYLVVGGHRRLIEASAFIEVKPVLSPDGRTAVFAAWVGQHNADSIALYAVPVDGSSDPRRLTPTSCTGASGGPLQGGCFDGTDGPDRVVGTKYGDLIIAGSGDDTIRAGDGQNRVESQWGNDDIRTGAGVDLIMAGAGNDAIRTGAKRDTIYTGPGRDQVFGGRGADVVFANDGDRDIVDCGLGDDRARVDRFDATRSCEHVTVMRPETDPRPPA